MQVSKHGAISVTEALALELQQRGVSNIHVHVLMPGVVATNIQQNANKLLERELSPKGKESVALFEQEQKELGMSPTYIAEATFDGITNARFYIPVDHPDPQYRMEFLEHGRLRYDRIESGDRPRLDGTAWGESIKQRRAAARGASRL